MIFQIRADRDVTSKAPEGTGTRRRTIHVSSGPVTLVLGAQPTYVECDELPIEIRTDGHLITRAVAPESLDVEIVVINLKGARLRSGGGRFAFAQLRIAPLRRSADTMSELPSPAGGVSGG